MRMVAAADMSKFVAPEGLQGACMEDVRPLQCSLPAAAFAIEAGEIGGEREVKKEAAEREGEATAATTPPAGSVRCSAGGVAYICIYVRSDYV
jgi:hypothetical protein